MNEAKELRTLADTLQFVQTRGESLFGKESINLWRELPEQEAILKEFAYIGKFFHEATRRFQIWFITNNELEMKLEWILRKKGSASLPKPNKCPFCHTETESFSIHSGTVHTYLRCDVCGAQGPEVGFGDDERKFTNIAERMAESVRRWNGFRIDSVLSGLQH